MPTSIGQRCATLMKRSIPLVGRVALSAAFLATLSVPALTGSISVAAQAATVTFDTAAAAPADSVAYTVTTLDDQSEQWKLADTLLDRAGVGEALDKAMAEGMTDDDGQPLPLDAFLGGEVAIVLSPVLLDTLAEESMGGADLDAMLGDMGVATPEADTTEPEGEGFAAILSARAPDTAWAGIRESALDGPSEESTYEGTSIIFTPPADDEDDGTAAARVGDLILLSSTPEDLFPLIDAADGRTPNITSLPEFDAARQALPEEYLSFSFINSFANQEFDLGPFAAASESLVTDSYTAMTLAADEPGFRFETVVLPAEGETLPPSPAPFVSELVDQAPDDSILFTSAADLGASGVLDAMGAMILGIAFGMGDPSMSGTDTAAADASPEEVIAQQYESAAALLGVNLQTDLFRQFAGEYGGWLTSDESGAEVNGLFVSHVADPATVSNALTQLSFLIQGATGGESALTTRPIGEGEVFVIELGDEAGSTLEFGVVGDQFVIGTGSAVDLLESPGESLSGNSQYQAVMDALPAEGNGYFYVDLTRALPLLEAASEEADDFEFGGMGEITDASETCADYATQAEAQAAYDAAEPDTFDLDQDFDGDVCEDFFAAGDDALEDDAMSDADFEAALAEVDYSAVKAFASVSFEDGGLQRGSSILYISE